GGGLARVHGSLSTLLPESAEVMGWDVSDDGLKVRFSQSIPGLVRSMMASNVEQLLTENGWTREELGRYVVHPGGVKVLDAYEAALGLAAGALDPSRKVLRYYGNMSSPTVLFVLDEVLRGRPGGRGVLSAMGPGFCAEYVLLEF
ncbi:MAG: 3-oxoacyl-[acyl-carrier-protein] synthase III C-terminal domain-containing protein, partial [Deinococcus sp.]